MVAKQLGLTLSSFSREAEQKMYKTCLRIDSNLVTLDSDRHIEALYQSNFCRMSLRRQDVNI